MGFSVAGQCLPDEASAAEHWRSIHGLGIVEMTLTHPVTGSAQPAQCFFTNDVWSGGGAMTIDRYCTFSDGELLQLPTTGVVFPVCDGVPDAHSVLSVFGWGVGAVLMLWALGYAIGAAVKVVRMA